MDDNGTIRLRKPKVSGEPANDVAEAAKELGYRLDEVYVTEIHDFPPTPDEMQELRDEIARFGLDLLLKVEEGRLTVEQAFYQIRARVNVMDCGYETTVDQRNELYGVGLRAAGRGVVQIARKLAATG